MMAPLINSDLHLTPHALDNPSPFVKLFEYLVEFCEIGPIILRSYFGSTLLSPPLMINCSLKLS